MITIDGSEGEGGGQVLRTSLTLSILTGAPIHIMKIRAGRRSPGLAPQHLAGVLAATRICHAQVRGAHLRSTELIFEPGGPARSGHYDFDISQMAGQGSAGAVTLLLQSIMLPLGLASGTSHLSLSGGTHVAWSPPAHYVEWTLLPTLARIGLRADSRLSAWGWYPQGGGRLEVDIAGGAALTGIDLSDRGDLVEVKGVAAVSNLPSHIPQRICGRANNALREAGLPGSVQPIRAAGTSTGAGLFVTLVCDHARAGFSALGEKGKPSEAVANEAVGDLLAYYRQGAALDRYLPDQLLVALALASGPSTFTTVEITPHLLTNASVIRRFVDRRIEISGEAGQPGTVHIAGDAPSLRLA
jgi:RNA 3'-terminal phosphate cyclase (ATP)